MNKPNLLNIPAAYKAGTIFSPIPESGAGDLTFTRAGVANRVNSNGVIEQMGTNVPRLDYSGGGCPSWLFEPQRTNLVKYSNNYSNAIWSKINTTISSNVAIAPDGTMTADEVFNNAGTSGRIEQAYTVADDSNNSTASVYVKKTTTDKFGTLQFQFEGGTLINYGIQFNKKDGSYLDVGILISGAGANAVDLGVIDKGEYWRVFIVGANNGSGNTSGKIRVNPSLGTSLGNTSQVDGSSVFWGAQLEAGGYPTSYIKTEASQVTRSADATTTTDVSSFVTATNGALMVDIDSVLGDIDGQDVCMQLGAANGRVYISGSSSNDLQAGTQDTNGVFDVVQLTTRSKVLFNWSSTNVDIWVDGVKAVSTGRAFSLTSNDLIIRASNSKLFNLYKLALWDTTLTDLEAIEQTT